MTARTPASLLSLRPRWSLWLAIGLLVFGLCGSLLMYRALQSAEDAALERYVSNLASYIEADMLGDLGEQINAQQRMALRLAADGARDESQWRMNARLYLDHYSYYRTLAVTDEQLQVRWLDTSAAIDLAPGQPLPIDDEYRRPLREAAQSGDLVVTRPFQLPDRVPGISFLTPVGTGDDHHGFLVAVLTIPAAIEAMIPSLFREEMSIHAETRGLDVYPHPVPEGWAERTWDADFSVDLDADERGFLFRFTLSEQGKAQLASQLPVTVLAGGITVSVLLALVAFLGMNAISHARRLAVSNQRLEREVRERELAEQELEFLVNHDPLTGVPNRTGSSDHIQRMIERFGDGGSQLALLFLDLDQFKDINDSLGHQLGDQLLCEIPRRLADVLRDRDFVGRHGGDEFLIAVVRNSREQVEHVAASVLHAMDEGFAIDDHRLFISASMGIAYYPESGRGVSELIQNADTALFKAKSAGRNQFAVFTREMFSQAQHRLHLSRDIRHGLDRGDFRVVYQPIVDVQDLRLVGLEALLRWRHEDGYIVAPQEFVRVAEETGIIGRLGKFAIEQALTDLVRWKSITREVPWLAINISGAQVREADFAEQLSVLLHQFRVDPGLLHLEITEEVLIENVMHNRTMLRKLDEIGMRITVDDFGVGYSSLAYLKNFPISVVKIDRGFVNDLRRDPEDQAITRTICSLAAELGMSTVAEGVEHADQLAQLRRYQCTYAQGFLFSRPIESEEVQDLIGGSMPWMRRDRALGGQ